jgi:hypothetical protein
VQINGFSFFELLILLELSLSSWRKSHFLSCVLIILLAYQPTKWTCKRVPHLVIWINCAIIWNLVQHRFVVRIICDGVNIWWAACFLSHTIDGSRHLIEGGALAGVVIVLAEWAHVVVVLSIVGDRKSFLMAFLVPLLETKPLCRSEI